MTGRVSRHIFVTGGFGAARASEVSTALKTYIAETKTRRERESAAVAEAAARVWIREQDAAGAREWRERACRELAGCFCAWRSSGGRLRHDKGCVYRPSDARKQPAEIAQRAPTLAWTQKRRDAQAARMHRWWATVPPERRRALARRAAAASRRSWTLERRRAWGQRVATIRREQRAGLRPVSAAQARWLADHGMWA